MKKTLYSYEAWGKHHIGIEINVDIDREFTDNDKSNMYSIGEQIVANIMEETLRLDPMSKITSEKERTELISLFGKKAIYVEEIPNGYCNRYCCKHLPWFIVTTKKGRIKIGWRKRVIQIDWEDSVITSSAEELFPKEDVTKFGNVIHAWGLKKAKKYINKLLQ